MINAMIFMEYSQNWRNVARAERGQTERNKLDKAIVK